MAFPVLQFKRGEFINLPGLRAGEPGFTTDKHDFYVGLTSDTATNKFFGSARYWLRENGSSAAQLRLVDKDGSNYIAIAASDTLAGVATYRLPNTTDGTAGDYLKLTSASGGYYDLEWASIPSGTFTIAGDSGTDTFTTGGTLTFTGGEGIDTAVTDDIVTITAEIASSTNAGIASFSASYFTVAAGGDVSIANADADGTTKGVAAFDTDDFDASSGVISLGDSVNGAVLAINGTTSEVEVSRSNGTVTVGLPDNVIVGGALTATTQFTIGTGVGVTQFSSSVSTGTSTSSVPTSSAVIDYVETQIGNVDLTLGIDADTGGPSTVSTAQTLTISGTANEIETSVSGQTIIVGLPADVVVGTSLSSPTVKTTNLQANDGTTSLTIANSTGHVTAAANLTVNGNLYVNGSTTQVNTEELTINDRTITLGIQTGTTSSTTTWDLGVMMNYGDAGVAKTAGVIWDYSVERFVFSANSDNPASGNDTTSPVITVAAHAPIEIGSLWVNDCAGQSQVISCTGTERFLENITVDGGAF
jgi:hypothetical protein